MLRQFVDLTYRVSVTFLTKVELRRCWHSGCGHTISTTSAPAQSINQLKSEELSKNYFAYSNNNSWVCQTHSRYVGLVLLLLLLVFLYFFWLQSVSCIFRGQRVLSSWHVPQSSNYMRLTVPQTWLISMRRRSALNHILHFVASCSKFEAGKRSSCPQRE